MQLTHATKKIRILLRAWAQVEELCQRRHRGPVTLRVRARGFLPGESLRVDFGLPNGFRAGIGARVTKLRRDPLGDTRELPELTIELVGLSRQVADRLMALAAPAESAPTRVPPARGSERVAPPHHPRVAEGTPSPEFRPSPLANEWEGSSWEDLMSQVCGRMKVSELLESNTHLRTQIEGLAERMRPRRHPAH